MQNQALGKRINKTGKVWTGSDMGTIQQGKCELFQEWHPGFDNWFRYMGTIKQGKCVLFLEWHPGIDTVWLSTTTHIYICNKLPVPGIVGIIFPWWSTYLTI